MVTNHHFLSPLLKYAHMFITISLEISNPIKVIFKEKLESRPSLPICHDCFNRLVLAFHLLPLHYQRIPPNNRLLHKILACSICLIAAFANALSPLRQSRPHQSVTVLLAVLFRPYFNKKETNFRIKFPCNSPLWLWLICFLPLFKLYHCLKLLIQIMNLDIYKYYKKHLKTLYFRL